jgi:hypothetical protein
MWGVMCNRRLRGAHEFVRNMTDLKPGEVRMLIGKGGAIRIDANLLEGQSFTFPDITINVTASPDVDAAALQAMADRIKADTIAAVGDLRARGGRSRR